MNVPTYKNMQLQNSSPVSCYLVKKVIVLTNLTGHSKIELQVLQYAMLIHVILSSLLIY